MNCLMLTTLYAFFNAFLMNSDESLKNFHAKPPSRTPPYPPYFEGVLLNYDHDVMKKS